MDIENTIITNIENEESENLEKRLNEKLINEITNKIEIEITCKDNKRKMKELEKIKLKELKELEKKLLKQEKDKEKNRKKKELEDEKEKKKRELEDEKKEKMQKQKELDEEKERKRKELEEKKQLLPYQREDIVELGIDECGLGSLFGPCFVSGVILPKNIKELILNSPEKIIIRDSKKMNRKQRETACEFIEKHAVEYFILSKTNEEIDEKNILQIRYESYHEIIKNMNIRPEKILIDGDKFQPYENIDYECINGGDNIYMCIAAASILSKTYHDRYLIDLVEKEPELEKYDLVNNMGYGTANHLKAIEDHGITKYHRMSYGICRKFSNGRFLEREKEKEKLKKDYHKSFFENYKKKSQNPLQNPTINQKDLYLFSD